MKLARGVSGAPRGVGPPSTAHPTLHGVPTPSQTLARAAACSPNAGCNAKRLEYS